MGGSETAQVTAENILALNEFLLDIDCLDELTEAANKINIFDILKISRTEIRHSNMLDWLLDPNENHGFGDSILRGLIRYAAQRNEGFEMPSRDLCDFKVWREWKHTDLIAVSNSEKIVLCLENKIDSGEHDDQLGRYEREVETAYPDYVKLYVFLTPDGKDASDPVWQSMSYTDVQCIIKQELEKAKLTPEVELLLRNYLDVIEYIVGERKEDQLARICAEIYSKHQKALDLVFRYRLDNTMTPVKNLYSLEEEETAESKIEIALVKTSKEIYTKHKKGLDLLLRYRPDKAQKLARIFRAWAAERDAGGAIEFVPEKSGITMTRFKTAVMSALLHKTNEAKSGSGTQESYFYEIRNINGCAFRMQFAVSSKNTSEGFRELCNRISVLLRDKTPEDDWQWRTFFSTGRVEVEEDISKEAVFKLLDTALGAMLHFEEELRQHLAVESASDAVTEEHVNELI